MGPFTFINYSQVDELVRKAARGLISLGTKPGDRIGIYFVNCIEWKIFELASYVSSFAIVSLYDTLGAKAVQFIVGHAEVSIGVCNTKTYSKFIDAVRELGTNHPVKHLIVLGDFKEINPSEGEKLGFKVHSYEEFLKLGEQNPNVALTPPKPEDLCSIMYTR